MSNLKTTTELVKDILTKYPAARNNDNTLYLYVLKVEGARRGISLEKMSVLSFFLQMKELGVPSIESVGRCRRKIVETHPELAGNDVVEGYRVMNEETFREYARQVIV